MPNTPPLWGKKCLPRAVCIWLAGEVKNLRNGDKNRRYASNKPLFCGVMVIH